MKAQSYGRYEVIDDQTAVTWEQAEALARRARGEKIEIPPAPEAPVNPTVHEVAAAPPETLKKLFEKVEDISIERHLLNKALILLIHLREKVFKEDPQVEAWVNEILDGVRQGKRI